MLAPKRRSPRYTSEDDSTNLMTIPATKTPLVLTDAAVENLTDMAAAIAAVEKALRANATGSFVAPARHRVRFGHMTDLLFAVGGSTESGAVAGFRAYYSRAAKHYDDQVVAVWDMATGTLKGVILGAALGIVRMGAIGGAAINALARPDAAVVAVIGAGRQAASHLEAAAAVRDLREVRVHSRDETRCRSFADRMSEKLGITVLLQKSARAAIEGADIVLLATTSLRPVLRADWLSPGAFVHTVGFKSPAGKEMDLDVAERADLLATDSPAQIAAAGNTFILHGTAQSSRVIDLADIVSGKAVGPTDPKSIRVCYPMGLAGSEVVVADDILRRLVVSSS
jgi:ornithine cyclodeaminase/alanine dehydrogenase-like protein (mu-crystallin family)